MFKKLMGAALAASLSIGLAACGGDDKKKERVPEAEALSWSNCSLLDGRNDNRAECTDAELPWVWNEVEDERMNVRVKRLVASGTEERTFWFLDGGPGSAGTINLPPFMQMLHEQDPNLTLYAIDARGTGYSTFLGCADPDAEPGVDEFEAIVDDVCRNSLEQQFKGHPEAFGFTQIAEDLAYFINETRNNNEVFVWGGSGGTFWAQRLLVLYPNLVDGVILEGVLTPTWSHRSQPLGREQAGENLIELCTRDTECFTRMNSDPEAVFASAFQNLTDRTCDLGENGVDDVKSVFSSLMLGGNLHAMIPGLVSRIARCDDADLLALANLDAAINQPAANARAQSNMLHLHVIRNELWGNDNSGSAEEFQSFIRNDLAPNSYFNDESFADISELMSILEGQLSSYEDNNDDINPTTTTPVLILQGAVDPATPVANAMELRDLYNGTNQQVVIFPEGTHTVFNTTPVVEGQNEYHCAQNLIIDFIQNPQAELNTDCVDAVTPIDFVGENVAPLLLGTNNYWDN